MLDNANKLTNLKTEADLFGISTFLDVLHYQASFQPQETAFIFLKDGETESGRITYAELVSRARCITGCLQAHEIKPGDRALLLYPSGLEFIIAFLGCLSAGVIAVPNKAPQSKRDLSRLQAIAADAEASIILTDSQILAERNQKLAYPPELGLVPWAATDTNQWNTSCFPEVTGDTLAFLQYTSGSTSLPKGVMLSHNNILHNQKLIQKAFEHDSQTVIVSWLPLFHDMGLIGNVLQPIYLGRPCIIMPPIAFLQNPVRWLKAISKYKATTSGGPNFAYDYCVRKVAEAQKSELDLSNWSIAFNGSEPVRYETLIKFASSFAQCGFRPESFYPCYGMAETTLMISGSNKSTFPKNLSINKSALTQNHLKPEESSATQILVSNGQVGYDLEVIIVHPETLTIRQPDQVGEIWVSGASVAQGYWRRTTETAYAFQAYLKDENRGPFLRTGDLGFLHDSELYFTGRFKDLIIIRGNNYYPQDIELSVESSHQKIRSNCSASFSIEVHETEQLVIVAEVERNCDNYSEVIRSIRNRVGSDYDLAVYAVVLIKAGTIPKTSSGKIQRHICRAQFLDNTLRVITDSYLEIEATSQENDEISSSRVVLSEPNSIQKWIEQWLMVELKLPSTAIDSNKTFAEYGLDSVSVAELGVALEAKIDHVIKIDPDLFRDYPTVAAFVKHLSNLINPESSESDSPDPGLARLAIYDQIPQILRRVTKQQNRQIFIDDRWICDFASCNYLGLDLHPQIHESITSAVNTWGSHPSWTRAVASPDLYHQLEEKLAKLANASSVRVFPSTTLLHMGVIPVLAGKEGIVFIDNATHRSVAEACHLAQQNGATVIHYRHNNLDDLAYKLGCHAKARIKLIAIDGVYSMSANYPDLPSYVNLAKKFDATIYVDDAHGFGILGENPTPEMPYGQKGNGIVNYFGLDYARDNIFYCAALSKAFSSYAAFITCGDPQMKKVLSTAWTGVFSGPLPVPSLATAVAGLEVNLNEGAMIRQRIYKYTRKLVIAAREIGLEVDNHNYFPIVSIVVGSVESVILACKILWEHGILITPGIYPAVPEHRNLLRFSITAANTDVEIDRAIVALKDIHAQLTNNK